MILSSSKISIALVFRDLLPGTERGLIKSVIKGKNGGMQSSCPDDKPGRNGIFRAEIIALETGDAQVAFPRVDAVIGVFEDPHRTHVDADTASFAEFRVQVHFCRDGCWYADLHGGSRPHRGSSGTPPLSGSQDNSHLPVQSSSLIVYKSHIIEKR